MERPRSTHAAPNAAAAETIQRTSVSMELGLWLTGNAMRHIAGDLYLGQSWQAAVGATMCS
jgi:hypothetical protein